MNKKHLSLILVLVFSLTFVSSGCLDKIKDYIPNFGGCGSPECAVNSFSESVGNGNYEKAISYSILSFDDVDDEKQAEDMEEAFESDEGSDGMDDWEVVKTTCVTSSSQNTGLSQSFETFEDFISEGELQEICEVTSSDESGNSEPILVVKIDGSYYVATEFVRKYN